MLDAQDAKLIYNGGNQIRSSGNRECPTGGHAMQKKASALLAISILLSLAFVPLSARFAAAKAAKDAGSALASISGTVRSDDGKPLRGAVVTVTSGNRSISRFTDPTGHYAISGLAPGSYNVAVTSWGYERKVDAKNLAGKVDMSVSLAQQWQPVRQLSSAQWYASLPKNAETEKLEFQCMGCHNASNLVRHRGSTADQWQTVVAPMGTDVLNDGEMAAARKNALDNLPILTKYFGPTAAAPAKDQVIAPEISDAVLKATFKEYATPAASYVHSLTVDPITEQVYFTVIDRATNALGQFDIKTEKITEHRFNADFSQPHNAVVSPDGKVWVSLNNAHEVGLYDPKTGKVSEFPAVAVGHTIDADWNGMIWESGPGVFKFDPETHESKQYFLPKPPDGTIAPGKSMEIMALDAAPSSGDVCGTYDLAAGAKAAIWFTCSNPGYIGKLDPQTKKIKMYRIANAGAMKGIMVDPNSGDVWFSSFSDHKLGRIVAKTDEVKLYQAPTEHAGFYGILVDRYTKDIWVSDYEGSHIDRFNPQTEQFTEYPLPRNDGMPRFMGQDAQGRIWYTEWRGKFGVLDPGDLQPERHVAKIIRSTRQ
jgi:virginiamycin B lyase